jgi:hypothetical protein
MQMETVAVVNGIPNGAMSSGEGVFLNDGSIGTIATIATIGTIGTSEAALEPAHDGALAPEELEAGWSATFLSAPGNVRLGVEARRFGTALGLSAAYGAALGLRGGARGMLLEAVAMPAAWLAVAALGVPALAILLALADAPVRALDLAGAASRAAARASLILVGLAPPIALFSVTTDEAPSAVLLGGLGLAVAWSFGLRAFAGEILRATQRSRGPTLAATLGFALFSTALAGRVWLCGLLPLWGAP